MFQTGPKWAFCKQFLLSGIGLSYASTKANLSFKSASPKPHLNWTGSVFCTSKNKKQFPQFQILVPVQFLSVPWSLRPQNRAAVATCGRGRCELLAILTPKKWWLAIFCGRQSEKLCDFGSEMVASPRAATLVTAILRCGFCAHKISSWAILKWSAGTQPPFQMPKKAWLAHELPSQSEKMWPLGLLGMGPKVWKMGSGEKKSRQ